MTKPLNKEIFSYKVKYFKGSRQFRKCFVIWGFHFLIIHPSSCFIYCIIIPNMAKYGTRRNIVARRKCSSSFQGANFSIRDDALKYVISGHCVSRRARYFENNRISTEISFSQGQLLYIYTSITTFSIRKSFRVRGKR